MTPQEAWRRGQSYGLSRAWAEAKIAGLDSFTEQLWRIILTDLHDRPDGVRDGEWDLDTSSPETATKREPLVTLKAIHEAMAIHDRRWSRVLTIADVIEGEVGEELATLAHAAMSRESPKKEEDDGKRTNRDVASTGSAGEALRDGGGVGHREGGGSSVRGGRSPTGADAHRGSAEEDRDVTAEPNASQAHSPFSCKEADDVIRMRDADLDKAGNVLGAICCAATLRPGERIVDPPDHASMAAMLSVIEERDRLYATLSRLGAWTHEFGAALKPTGADTYGEGVRACKAQVAAILSAGDDASDTGGAK